MFNRARKGGATEVARGGRSARCAIVSSTRLAVEPRERVRGAGSGAHAGSAMTLDPLDVALDEARSGEQRGVSALYRAFHPGLVRYLRHHARGEEEDLASEVWIGAAKLLPRFQGDARAFRALLFTVARRRVVDHHRRTGRSPSLVELSAEEEPLDEVDVERAVLAELSAQQAIALLVRNLPPTQAEVVLLRVVGDLSVEQVAEVLGRSSGSVRVLQHRALQRLAKDLKKPRTSRRL
jgi:RNA polymerase sigma-70 factor, ECF subfamily